MCVSVPSICHKKLCRNLHGLKTVQVIQVSDYREQALSLFYVTYMSSPHRFPRLEERFPEKIGARAIDGDFTGTQAFSR
jgi:hypothetical protein